MPQYMYSDSKGEYAVRRMLEKYGFCKLEKCKRLNGMEIDIYCPNVNGHEVGIEHDGKGHDDEEGFLRDLRKDEICKEENIFLYRIRQTICKSFPIETSMCFSLTDDSTLSQSLLDTLNLIIFDMNERFGTDYAPFSGWMWKDKTDFLQDYFEHFCGIECWDDESEKYLLENKEKPLAELSEYLGRSPKSVSQKLRRLGYPAAHQPFWTCEENELLRSLRDRPTTEIADKFPNRNYNAINAQREKLGAGYFQTTGVSAESSREQWTLNEEIDLINSVLHNTTFDSRSEKSKRHRMTKIRNSIRDLRKSGLSFEEIEKRTGFSKDLAAEVYENLRRLWSDEELALLRENKDLPLDELADLVGRTEESVRTKLSREGLLTAPAAWSEEELDFLKAHPEMTAEEISQNLPGRTASAVRTARHNAGIVRSNWQKWTPEDVQILKKNIDLPTKELEKLLPGKNKNAINSKKRRLRLAEQQ